MAGFLNYNKTSFLLLALGALAVGIYGYFVLKPAPEERRRIPPAQIITFSGITPGTIQGAWLVMNGAESPVLYKDNALELSEEQIARFSLPYEIKLSYKTADNSFKDISWRVDERGVEYFIRADGYSPKDKISLFMKDQKVYTIPFDWSGRIELPILLIIAEDTKACFEIEEDGKQVSACHFITGKKSA